MLGIIYECGLFFDFVVGIYVERGQSLVWRFKIGMLLYSNTHLLRCGTANFHVADNALLLHVRSGVVILRDERDLRDDVLLEIEQPSMIAWLGITTYSPLMYYR